MRIAVVGSGIAGMGAAWLLGHPAHGGADREVHLFEGAGRLGGHTHTHAVPTAAGGTVNVDSGFIVYNEPTYPNLTRLFAELGVETQLSDMSFGLEDLATGFEYAGSKEGLFPTWREATDPMRVKLAAGILRFNWLGRKFLDDPRASQMTLGAFLKAVRLDGLVADHYVLPMAAAIWSTGTGPVRDFPLKTFLDFFNNHGLLGVASHHPWRTVTGGSSSYIAPLTERLRNVPAGAERIHLGHRVRSIARDPDGVRIGTAQGEHRFDAVVIAAHADQALEMLVDPTGMEKDVLGAWDFSTNEAWLHTDRNLMPKSRTSWASWNVRVTQAGRPAPEVSLTYWMNRLQRLDGSFVGQSDTEYLVTLNPSSAPRREHVISRMTYKHPVFRPASVASQGEIDKISGVNRTFYVGAWQRYGFHEDGLWSAVRMARHFGVDWGTV